jgi:hypothetical protein
VAYVFNLTAYEGIVLGLKDTNEHEAYAKDKYLSKDDVKSRFTGLMRYELNTMVSRELNVTLAKLQQKAQKAGRDFTLKDYIVTVRRTGSGTDTSYSVFRSGDFSELDEDLKKHIMSVAVPEDKPLPDLAESHILRKKYGSKKRIEENREASQSESKRPRRAGRTLADDEDEPESRPKRRKGRDDEGGTSRRQRRERGGEVNPLEEDDE